MSAYQNAFSQFLTSPTTDDPQAPKRPEEGLVISTEQCAGVSGIVSPASAHHPLVSPPRIVPPGTQDIPEDLSVRRPSPAKQPMASPVDLSSGSGQPMAQAPLDLSKPTTVPNTLSPPPKQGSFGARQKSIGSKLDKIAQKLMGGFSSSTATPDFLKATAAEEPVLPAVTSPKMLPQDEAAVQPDTVEPQITPPPERPFSVLLPPAELNDDSQPEFVEELVSDNVLMEFGEGLEGNSESCSQNEESVDLATLQEDASVSSVPIGEAEDDAQDVPERGAAEPDVQGSESLETGDVPEPEGLQDVEEDAAKSVSESTAEVTEEVSQGTTEKRSALKLAAVANGIKLDHPKITAETLFEYQWPPERGGDIFMLQEQVSEYLGVLSFKRKYPDLQRRPVEYKERIFLMEHGAVTEVQCDLGLTVLRSEEVYELMSKDYPAKYKDYVEALRERERKRMSEENRGYSMQNIEKAKVEYLTKKAIRAAATFNAQFMQEKREERRAYFDLQTFEVQFPRGKYKPVPKEMTKMGAYPLALIPGQYQDFYKSYTPQELRYFPVKTALYSPHRALRSIYADPANKDDKDTADEEKDDVSSSSDDSSGSSDSEPDSIEGEVTKNQISEEQIKKLLATPRPDTPPKKARRKPNPNGADTGDSEKDSESGSVKGRPRKTPGKKTPARKTPSKRLGRPPLVSREKCNLCLELTVEELVQCFECKKFVHPTCAELTTEMVPIIRTYPWQCMECKACVKCKDAQDEEKMMFCDLCDRGYHTYCVGLSSIPEGRWECPTCTLEGPTPKKKAKQK